MQSLMRLNFTIGQEGWQEVTIYFFLSNFDFRGNKIAFSVVRYEKLVFLFSFAGRKALFFVPTLNKQFFRIVCTMTKNFSHHLYNEEKLFVPYVKIRKKIRSIF